MHLSFSADAVVIWKRILNLISPLTVDDTVQRIARDIECESDLETSDLPQHITADGVAVSFGHLLVFTAKILLDIH